MNITAISPLDGRYAQHLVGEDSLRGEYALMHKRIAVEIAWFLTLAQTVEIPELSISAEAITDAKKIITDFDVTAAQRIKAIEQQTHHDVKAVEYYLRERFRAHPSLAPSLSFIHFACTSEDINNCAYALLIHEARVSLCEQLDAVLHALSACALEYAATPMLARTHGQAATPTTLGKEFSNFVYRLSRQKKLLIRQEILAKMNGAVGNFNAHLVAYPKVDWEALSQRFIIGLGLDYNPCTAQNDPHDWLAEWAQNLQRINVILMDFARDIWGYAALGYWHLATSGCAEVGSSTMPHKINPIDFENAEGNLGVANALLAHFAEKLPLSRWQRDLSDSTVLRNLPSAIAYSLLAWQALARGIKRLRINRAALQRDLDQAPQVLAEAVQTVMRREGILDAYEQLKELTQGRLPDRAALDDFIADSALSSQAKQCLHQLTPQRYLGLATELARCYGKID